MPTAPNNKITIAAVVHSHSSSGVLEVRLTLGSKLNEDELVEFGPLANGQILTYVSANGRFENSNVLVSAYSTLNAAFDVANAAYGNANSVAVAANNYAGFMANSVNTFTSATYSTLTQWGFSFTVTNAAYTVANAAFGYANNLGYYAGNNGDKGNAAGLGDIFRVHSNTLTQNVTIYSGNNALAAGPITVASGRTLAIQTGARLAIV
jgi:hypothetical protein